VTAYLNKAAILVEMNRIEEALVCYDKLLEINATSSIAINRKRKLFYKLNKNSIKLHELNGKNLAFSVVLGATV
jgi:tetratricopeptide (TPR) repeat protein